MSETLTLIMRERGYAKRDDEAMEHVQLGWDLGLEYAAARAAEGRPPPVDELAQTQEDTEHARFLRWRGIRYAEDVCRTCRGAGRRYYNNTSGWRRGVGGAMCTMDVCDQCWGSGDRMHPGANLRQLADEEGERVAAAAVDALARSCGATLSTARVDVMEIVAILREAADKTEKARRVPARRGSPWFVEMVKGLAETLERAVRAK